jgi:tRNA(Ile)-lysidine synthase
MTGPPPGVAAVRLAVRAAVRACVEPGAPLLVACSGGADSLAVAEAAARLAPAHPVSAAVVDHGLQPGSASRAARTAELLGGLGMPATVLPVMVTGGGGLEAAARRVRYAALRSAASSAGPGAAVLLGHTLDDQAETVLLGLGRGSGPRSLSGMRRWDPPWLRPLLAVRRATTRAACKELGIEVWDDPHNADPRFTRVRLRGEVLPLLEEVLAGGVAPALARTAEQLAEDCAALDEWAGRIPVPPEVASLRGLPAAVRRRVLRRWLSGRGVPALTDALLRRADALIGDWHGQGGVALPGGLVLARRHGKLVLTAGRSGVPTREAARVVRR